MELRGSSERQTALYSVVAPKQPHGESKFLSTNHDMKYEIQHEKTEKERGNVYRVSSIEGCETKHKRF